MRSKADAGEQMADEVPHPLANSVVEERAAEGVVSEESGEGHGGAMADGMKRTY